MAIKVSPWAIKIPQGLLQDPENRAYFQYLNEFLRGLYTRTGGPSDLISTSSDELIALRTLSGTAEGAVDLGSFTGVTVPTSSDNKEALQALETAYEETDANTNDLVTLSGVAENSTSLGTFSGSTIPDSSTVKASLQALETSLETKQDALVSGTNIKTVNSSSLLGSGNLSVGTVTSISATAPAAGFTVSGSPINSSGTLTFALADDLAAVEGLATTGIATRTAFNTWTTRTITGTASRITITEGDGVSGNPTLDISSAYVGQSSITTLGTIISGVWNGTALVTTCGGTGLTSYTAGDLAYYASGTALTKLAIGANNYVLTSSGTAPQWTATTGTGNVVRASSPSFTTTIGVGGATASASGSGISFPASQSASTDPNTLDDYEEGAWTPVDSSGAGLGLTVSAAKYTKFGDVVTLSAAITYPATASGAAVLIGGIPFTVASSSAGTTKPWTNAGVDFTLFAYSSFGVFMRTNANVDITNAQMSGKFIYFTLQYQV